MNTKFNTERDYKIAIVVQFIMLISEVRKLISNSLFLFRNIFKRFPLYRNEIFNDCLFSSTLIVIKFFFYSSSYFEKFFPFYSVLFFDMYCLSIFYFPKIYLFTYIVLLCFKYVACYKDRRMCLLLLKRYMN